MAYDKVSTDVLRSALAEPLSHEVASNAVAATTESIIFFMSIVLYCCFFCKSYGCYHSLHHLEQLYLKDEGRIGLYEHACSHTAIGQVVGQVEAILSPLAHEL